MFNNPFDSFHNTVAEAKEEREQLDLLLTISTPHEKAIVISVFVVLLGLVAWLIWGSVQDEVAIDGVVAEWGVDSTSVNLVSVVAIVDSDTIQQVKSGQSARIRLKPTESFSKTLRGQVADIRNLPSEIRSPTVSPKRIAIAIEGEVDPMVIGVKDCRVIVNLGKQSPLTLFGSRLF